MPKFCNDAGMDASFDYYDQCNEQRALSTYAFGDSYATVQANTLATVTMVPDTDYTKANGDVSGRKVTVAAKSGTVSTGGTVTHTAICRSADSSVRAVTTVTSQVLGAGNPINFPAWDIEIPDPA